MIEVKDAASYIYQRYRNEYNTEIDEMKLHKLLYFTQRESIIITGEPMFSAQFEAWKYGPVLVQIRDCYRTGGLNNHIDSDKLKEYQDVFNYVFENYAKKTSWSLSMLTHGEISWQKARKDTPFNENSSELIKLEDIREDAERIKSRRFYFNEILPQLNANK